MTPGLIPVPAASGVRAWFTTRAGGVSTGPWAGLNLGGRTGDRPAAWRENRRLLCDAAGVDPDRVTLGAQVHGTGVLSIARPTRPGGFLGGEHATWPEGDGLVTEAADLPLVALGADCLPVLAWRGDGSAVGAAHAGWRGLVGGIMRNLVDRLGDPATLGVAIGPGVRPCCYPVDPGLRERFADRFGGATVVGDAVDLAGAARADLVSAGVPEAEIAVLTACTSCEPDRFYSYRRDGAKTGRHAGLIVRTAS